MEIVQVLCTLRFTDDLLTQVRAVSPRLRVTQQTCRNAEEVAAALQDYPDTEVLYTFDLPREVLDLAPRLRWLQLHSAGADHILDLPVMHSEVTITTTSGIHATPIAEYVLARSDCTRTSPSR